MKKQAWAFPSAHSWIGPLRSWLNCRNHSLLTSWDRFAPPTTQLLLCRDAGLTDLRESGKDKIQRKRKRRRIWQMRMHRQVLTLPVCQSLDNLCFRKCRTYHYQCVKKKSVRENNILLWCLVGHEPGCRIIKQRISQVLFYYIYWHFISTAVIDFRKEIKKDNYKNTINY